MYRFTSIIMAAFIYLPARFMVANFISSTSVTAGFAVNLVPLIFSLIFVGIVIFAVK